MDIFSVPIKAIDPECYKKITKVRARLIEKQPRFLWRRRVSNPAGRSLHQVADPASMRLDFHSLSPARSKQLHRLEQRRVPCGQQENPPTITEMARAAG
jgi:hypothetical protein